MRGSAEAYRAAVLAYRQAYKTERERWGQKMHHPYPKHAAAEAVLRLSPELTYEQAHALAHEATAWAAQAHNEWFWKGISPIAD